MPHSFSLDYKWMICCGARGWPHTRRNPVSPGFVYPVRACHSLRIPLYILRSSPCFATFRTSYCRALVCEVYQDAHLVNFVDQQIFFLREREKGVRMVSYICGLLRCPEVTSVTLTGKRADGEFAHPETTRYECMPTRERVGNAQIPTRWFLLDAILYFF